MLFFRLGYQDIFQRSSLAGYFEFAVTHGPLVILMPTSLVLLGLGWLETDFF